MTTMRAALLCLVLFSLPAFAHEAQLSDGRVVDYTGLKTPGGFDCCGERDCRAVEWREVEGGTLEALLPEFGWVPMPPTRIIEPHPDAPDLMHVCYKKTAPNIRNLKIYCVMPPGFGA